MKKDNKGQKNTVIEVSEADLNDKNSKFEFYATYWAKLPQPILGLHVIKLVTKSSDTKETRQERGLKVIAVIKDSPAFKAGIQKGDVVLALNDSNTESPEEFSKSVFKQQGNRVKIKFARDDEEKEVAAELNRR
jgi:S1-C subfamily serine protease